MIDFKEFPRIPRLSRECIITEKIDGTNGVICITEKNEFFVGSRSRWITPEQDNQGFAKWAYEHREELMQLGTGYHYGEWWGQGIQRKYGLSEKRFSLFNVSRWEKERPSCCYVVPILFRGTFSTEIVNEIIEGLRHGGSMASPGFMEPEGVVVYHIAGNYLFKKTLVHDELSKSALMRKA